MRSSICVLLAAIAVLTSCSTYLQSGSAAKFQDGIYYKASDVRADVDTSAVSTSLTSASGSGNTVNVYLNPVGFSLGFAVGYPWINGWYWDNWYWDRWYRPWRPWGPWGPWDPWYRPWGPWGPGPIYIRDPFAIWTTRDVRASGGGFTYRGTGSAGRRYVSGFNGGSSSSGTYGRSLATGEVRSSGRRTVTSTAVNRQPQSPSSRAYGRDVSGVGGNRTSTQSQSYRTVNTGSASYRSSGGYPSGGSSRPSGGFSSGMSSHSGGAGRRR